VFDRNNVPVRIADIAHRQMEHDEKEIALVELQLEINPLTRELVKELDDFVRRTLFTATDAEVTSKLKGASFQLPIRPQAIVVRMAPDQGEESFTIDEAKVGVLHARRSKKSPTWRLVFTVTCSPASEHQLSQIVDAYLKTRYLTFANASPGLFDEEEKEARRQSKDAKPVRSSGSGATAH
jgi:hypothetical protein